MATLSDLTRDEYLSAIDEYYKHPPLCAPCDHVAWLKNHGEDPEFWHYTAMTWNWDSGTDVLRWIIGQPACNAATASWLLIVCNGGTLWTSREECEPAYHPVFDLFAEIAERCRAEFYTDLSLGFNEIQAKDFRDSVERYRRLCLQLGDPVIWRLPPAAYQPFPGRDVGFPKHVIFEDGRLQLTLNNWYESLAR